MRKTVLVLVIVLLALLVLPNVAHAQEDEEPVDVPVVVEVNDNTFVLPEWFNNLAVAGLALSPVTVAIAQVLKVIGAKLGLPEGYSGYIVVIVAVVMIVVAFSAEVLNRQTEVSEWLALAQRVAETMLVVLTALGWYTVGKSLNVLRSVAWKKVA